MQGLTNGRGLDPLFEGSFGVRAAPGTVDALKSGRRSLGVAARKLDGVGGLGWSVIGFLVGAVFWHFVGFWGFVSDVVLAGHPTAVSESRYLIPGILKAGAEAGVIQPAHASPDLVAGDHATGGQAAGWEPWLRTADASGFSVSPQSCVSLLLDRRTGLTSSQACEADAALLPADSYEGREDRAVVAERAAGDGPITVRPPGR
jgi:hypothetical protein